MRPQENPETLEALRRRIPLIPRAEMLGELMRMKFGIGVAGTHGKTTTTSMVGLVVSEGGFDPTIIVGGKVAAFESNAVAGEGDIIVIEADEYDRTFLRLTPTLAVVTSIEPEHLDVYRDLDDLMAAFRQFAGSVPFFGAAILCLDDPNVQALVGQLDRRVRTYGLARQAEIRAENVRFEGFGSRFDVLLQGELLGTIQLQVPGLHNVRNALAAVAVGLELDIPFECIQAGLARFTGSVVASSGWARCTACWSSTTTPTILRKSGPRWKRRPRSCPTGGWWPSSSRICTVARGTFRRTLPGLSWTPTCWW